MKPDAMDSNPSVLMIAYYFPPMGGAGVQRTLKFVKYLPEYGWNPHVLTTRPPRLSLRDEGLMIDIRPDTPITRTTALLPPQCLPWRVRSFITRWFLTVDEQVGWMPFAIRAGSRIIDNNPVKVIYSTSAPYTAHLIARHLHLRTNIPWVADFRDPWMGNPYIEFPTAFHRQLNKHLEQRVFIDADRLILNTERSRQYYMRKYATLSAEKFSTISNGYDQSDLLGVDHDYPTNSVFTIAHLGTLYRKTRSSDYLLTALHEAFTSGKLAQNKIKVRFIGNIDKETQGLVRQYKLVENVELLGYLPHRQAVNQLLTADLLLLIPSHGAGSELFVPAKIFEYLAIRKPILCLADPGDTADMVLKARAGIVVSPTDTHKIVEQLVSMYQLWQNGHLSIEPDQEMIQSFERRKLTEQLASIFNGLAGKTV